MKRRVLLLSVVLCASCSSDDAVPVDQGTADIATPHDRGTADVATPHDRGTADVSTGDVGKPADAAAPDVQGGDATVPDRYFEHEFPGCTSDGFFNCKPHLELCADGKAIIVVTDIINGGTYTETAASVTTAFPAGDVPAAIVFSVIGGGQALQDDWQGWTWQRVANPGSWLCDVLH